MKLVDWLEEQVTNDPRALRWFEEKGSDERIAEAFKELLVGYRIDPSTILKTTRMLRPDERPARRAPGHRRGQRDRVPFDLCASFPALLRPAGSGLCAR